MNPIELFTKLSKKKKKGPKGKPKCQKCGFRIRGKVADHEAGPHHQHGKFTQDAKGKSVPVNFRR
jgi:hypothetical protein